MKVTDYIISFLISKGITDIFGYPGGVICHLLDSASKYRDSITAHCTYHEQAAAFAACGYAQESRKVGVAYSTSGPGATNLVTGIANAYFDSIPTIFFTGQVDTYGMKENLPIRQRGFQETDVVSITESITKYAVCVKRPEDIKYCLEKAYYIATEGNPGPVLLDLPADVQRADVDLELLDSYKSENEEFEKIDYSKIIENLQTEIEKAKFPCFLIGNGVKQSGMVTYFEKIICSLNIPAVFSMPAFDTLPYNHHLNFGFIGANGHRYANFILSKSDLIISLGSRLDLKQVGNKRNEFALNAKLVRIDIDKQNFSYPVREDEIQVHADMIQLLPQWIKKIGSFKNNYDEWIDKCRMLKKALEYYDDTSYTCLIREVGKRIPPNTVITADVGQSEVWIAQNVQVKEGQSVHLSAGHGTMGYSLPAAIGSYYGNKKEVYCFNGDGGIQMNLQELQYVVRENLPVKIVILNNYALGMIRGFQEANFEENYVHTIEGKGYSAPDFSKIAYAYQIPYFSIHNMDELKKLEQLPNGAAIIEVKLPVNTVLCPNFGATGVIQDQRPYIDRELYDKLMSL